MVSRTDAWQEQATMDKIQRYTVLIFSHILILRRTYILPQAGTNHVSPFNVQHIYLTIIYSGDMKILMQNIPSNFRYTFPCICLWEWRHDAGGMHTQIKTDTQMRWAIAGCNNFDNMCAFWKSFLFTIHIHSRYEKYDQFKFVTKSKLD